MSYSENQTNLIARVVSAVFAKPFAMLKFCPLSLWLFMVVFFCEQVSGYQQIPYNVADARSLGGDQKYADAKLLNAGSMAFSNDGLKLFVSGQDKFIYEYALTTAYDLNTISYSGDGERLQLAGITRNIGEVLFNNDGSRFFVVDFPFGSVTEYHLSTAFDISTAVYQGNEERFSLSAYGISTRGASFNSSGTRLFVTSQEGNKLMEFNLGTAYDVSTAVYAGASEDFSPDDKVDVTFKIRFNDDGKQLFFNDAKKLVRFDLSTAFDISTASFAGEENQFVYGSPQALSFVFGQNGLKFFFLNSGGIDSHIQGYEVGPFDTQPPVVADISRTDSNPLGGATANWQVNFSEDVTGVDLADFELALTGTMAGNLVSVTAVNDSAYKVSANGLAGAGTIGLNLKDDDSIQDLAGNALGDSGLGNGDFVGELYTTNVAPTDVLLSKNTIAENNDPNQLVGLLSSVDPDTGDSHSYTLVSGAGDTDNGSFFIVSDLLLAADLFDFETRASYSIRVRSTDSQNNTFEKELAIVIEDANDRPIRINLSNQSFLETSEVGTVIGELSTEDQDVGDAFAYVTVSGNGAINNNLVSIVGNQVATADIIDFETIETIRIRIRVTDAGGATNERPFVLTIMNIEKEGLIDFTKDFEGAKIKNFFTPNADGVNDVWVIEEIKNNPENTVKVYTQSGQLVFSANNYRNDWDGTYKGDILPSGTYYYEINIYNGQSVILGFLTLATDK